MPTRDEMLVCVHGEWDGWRTAQVRLRDLQVIHWLQPGRAPIPLLHGYISCADIMTGEIPHDCARTAGPHRVLVCVLKRHNGAGAYAELARRADERRAGPAWQRTSRLGARA